MDEVAAKSWLDDRGWWSGQIGERLRRLADLVLAANREQNLISESTENLIWSRHIVDSAQLLSLESSAEGLWIDLGSGAGFPGAVIACIIDRPLMMVEMRRGRAEFLQSLVDELELDHVIIARSKVEQLIVQEPAVTVSARAYAPLEKIFASAAHLADETTQWILPKGRKGEIELESVRSHWQAMFHVEHSVTDAESVIIVAQGLSQKPVIQHSSRSNRNRPQRRKKRS